MKNDLLDLYKKQIEKDDSVYSYAFYDVYEVSIGGYDGGSTCGGCCVCGGIILCCIFSLATGSCGFEEVC